MARTTSHTVQAILAGHYDGETDLSPFIETACNLVDWVDECSEGELSATTLKLIEGWLTAHFYMHADQPFQQKQTEKASATFQGKTEFGFSSTYYGQTAKRLDTSGCLAKLDEESQTGIKKIARLFWLGTKPPVTRRFE